MFATTVNKSDAIAANQTATTKAKAAAHQTPGPLQVLAAGVGGAAGQSTTATNISF
jgi:hypothetical protein